MIIATSKSDTMLRKSLGRGQTSVIAINKMIEQFALDPTITEPKRDAYIVTNEDISANHIKQKFEQALLTKHPATKVIFINKTAKPIYPNGLQGLDAILQRPKPNDIAQAISVLVSETVIHDTVEPVMTPISQHIPTYNPTVEEELVGTEYAEVNPDFEEHKQQESEQPEELIIEEPTPIVQEPTPVPLTKESMLVERVKNAGSVSDVSVLMREITASTLVKDLIETNSTYAGIEEKLKSLNEAIFSILNDKTIRTLDEKLSKVHSLLHDKAFFSSKGNTLIEQRLEEVIDTICTRVNELLQNRLSEIDTAINRSLELKGIEDYTPRLAGLNSERTNLIIELQTLEFEIQDIYKLTDNLSVDVAGYIAQSAKDLTGNEMINAHIEARGTTVLTADTVNIIRAILDTPTNKTPEAFKEMKMRIINERKLLSKLFDLDQEIITAQQAVINYLKTKNIEDTVVAETLLKKSLRVYVGPEGCGRTIIPYLLSRYKSKQNANVLCLDLTGTNKYADYGIQYMHIDTYLTELNQRPFMLVAGAIDNSIEAAQKIVTTLLKAADYYRVINVVLSPEQRELLETIAQDVLSVNYMVDTNPTNIKTMRETIERSNFDNVARRVIINKCDIPLKSIITKLGLYDSLDFQICTIENIPTISEASLVGYNPYGISKVDFAMEETLKHA